MQIDPVMVSTQSNAEATAPAQANVRSATAPVESVTATQSELNDAELQKAVEHINRTLDIERNSLQFEVDADTGKTVVRLIDKHTGDVLRQVPSEEVLAIARAIPPISGALIKDTA